MSDFSRKRAAANAGDDQAGDKKPAQPGKRPPVKRPGGKRPGNDNPGGSTGAVELISLRTEFYKDRAQTLTWAALALFLAIGICVACIVMLAQRQPETLYIPTREDGTLARRVPVNKPFLTEIELNQWIETAVRKSFTFNYVYYNEELAEAEVFFTDRGHERFIEALNAQLLQQVLGGKLIIETRIFGAPQIDKAEVVSGKYTWDMTVPVRIRAYGGNVSNAPYTRVLCLTAHREDTLLNRDGIAINNLVLLPAGQDSCSRAR
ncbi:MAG: hypothetical protein Alpg2KO_24800 [Alphaproteobacteria bacterium]